MRGGPLMKTKIAINGFGRIGRAAFKIAFERDDLEVVAVNDLTDNKTLANLLKYDSNYGRYQNKVEFTEDSFTVNGQEVKSFSEKNPANLPWGDLGVQVVIESTGVFRTKEDASAHIKAGARQVIISAPAKDDETNTHVIGVNEDELNADDTVVSNASCTTNCISPVMSLLEATFGIEKALMTTIHSYTSDQRLQDSPHSDPRRARAAAVNIIPTTTGAAKATGQVIPSLKDNFDGMAVRVPTPTGSLSDFSILLKKDTTADELNSLFRKAAQQPYYQGIMTVTDDPIVSSDIVGDSHSAIVDLGFTKVVGGNLVKIVAWYDNEWGYSNRLVELVADSGRLLQFKDEQSAQISEEPKAEAQATAAEPNVTDNVPQTVETTQTAEATQQAEEKIEVAQDEAPAQEESATEIDQEGQAILDNLMKESPPVAEDKATVEVKDNPVKSTPVADQPSEFTDLEAKIREDLGISDTKKSINISQG